MLFKYRVMVAALWNALLQRYEYIQRSTVQRQHWIDRAGMRHAGVSYHNLGSWWSLKLKQRENAVMPPKKGKPQLYNQIAMQNEITAMLNDSELKEWRGLSVWCCHRTAAAHDLAFHVFFRRMKELSDPAVYEQRAADWMASHPTADGKPPRKPNRYQLAGYPPYKNPRKHNGIPHRFASGCKLTRDERYQEGSPRHERSWKVHVIGVRGKIDARAMFPFEIVKWADADVIWRDNNYWLSVCVAGDCSREHGDHPTTIKFNLLGEFATVLPAGLTAGGARVQCAMAELAVAQALQYDHECLKSQFDTDYPRGKRRTPTQQEDYVEWRWELTHLAARIARKRHNALQS